MEAMEPNQESSTNSSFSKPAISQEDLTRPSFVTFLFSFSFSRIYAFVAKRTPTSMDNQCHVFCELEPNQPAAAIVSFANKIILGGYITTTLPKNI